LITAHEKIETYEEAAPDMIAEASKRASKEITHLRDLLKRYQDLYHRCQNLFFARNNDPKNPKKKT
jgi:vacuolar-type H+-ATPase subunit H